MDLFGSDISKGRIIKFKCQNGIDTSAIVSIGKTLRNLYVIDFKMLVNERFGMLPCFDKKTCIFSYGHDIAQSRNSVTCLLLFGTEQCAAGDNRDAFQNLLNWYDSHRLSAGKKGTISILGADRFNQGYLQGFQLNAYSAELNAAAVTFTYIPTDD